MASMAFKVKDDVQVSGTGSVGEQLVQAHPSASGLFKMQSTVAFRYR